MRHNLKMLYYDVKDWLRDHVPAWLPTWLKLTFVVVIVGVLASVCFGCVSEAQAAPRNAGVTVTMGADSATVTLTWTAPPGNYDGFAASLAMTGGPVVSRALGSGVTSASFRVGKPLSDGQACVAATRSGKTGSQACAPVTITWPADPIPDVPIDTVVVVVDSVPSGPVDSVVPVPPDTSVVIGDYIPDPSSIAELPRIWLDSRMPAIKRTVPVTCATLQGALDVAQDGDRLALPANAQCTGRYIYRNQRAAVILTTATTLPPEGTRVTPETAKDFATLITSNSQPALDVTAMSSGLRVVGLAFRASDATKLTYMLVNLGPVVHRVDSLAHDITLDRVYMQGHDSLQLQRCVAANAARVVIVDSWLAGCHYKGADAQAIIAWNSPGPFKIVNNHLEGSGENVLFGGADPSIPNLVASDIEFRRNDVVKPLAWKDSTAWNPWTEKLLFELKSARRVLVEANVFANNWVDAQTGYAVWFKSANQSGKCDWCGTSDVIFRYNQIRNTTAGIAVTRGEAYSGGTYDPVHNVDIHDVRFDSVGTSGLMTSRRLLYLSGDMQHVNVAHVTSIDGGNYHAVTLGGAPFTGGAITDNLLTSGTYGIFCDGGKGFGATALANCWGGTFTGNVLIGTATGATQGTLTGNTYPATLPYTGPAGVDQVELAKRLAGVIPAIP